MFLCLPLTSLYLFFTSEENGLHLVALGISFFIMMLVVEDKHREKMLFVCLTLLLLTLGGAFKANLTIVWPSIFCWWHIFYIIGFLSVILLLRSSMHTLAVEREKAILTERCTLARSLSHDIMTPMMVMRMLLQETKPIDEKQRKLLLETLKEMGSIVDSIIPETLKNYEDLPLENLNAILKKSSSKLCFLHKNLTIDVNATAVLSARVDTALLDRILTNILNIGRQLFAGNDSKITIDLSKDEQGNVQIDIASIPNFPLACLRKIIDSNERMINEAGLGSSISDFQKIVKNWHGLLLVKDEDETKYLFRIVLPNENNSEIIGYEIDDDDI